MHTLDISNMSYDVAMGELQGLLSNKDRMSCHIEFWADHSQSKIIRDFVWMIFDKHNINHPWRGRFILITDELINNAIEHWSAQGDIDSCIIESWMTPDKGFYITLEVHDTGRWKDAKDAEHMDQVKAKKLEEHNDAWVHMEKRWRWLFYITEKLVDRLSFSESPKWWLAVKIEKNIPIETL